MAQLKVRNMIIKILLLILTVILALTIISCSDSPYGKEIEEDLTTTNIIDDNYRNYYEIYVRSFYDSNGDGIGDLNGVTAKLDYIKDLGFNGIWLMPINTSSSYHKYNVKDYYEIDPSYGTMDDFKNLINECHKRGIKLIIDLVLNHSASNNSWFIKAKEAYEKTLNNQTLTEEDEKFKDFYVFSTTQKSGYTEVNGKGYYYESNFDSGMPEFNCDSPYVREEFKNIIEYYLDMGLDGFRLDAVKYYYLNNTSKNVELLSYINKCVKDKNPNAYVVGEMWDISTNAISQYYESGIDSFFNFNVSVSNPSSGIINSVNQEGRMLNSYYDALVSNEEMAGNNIPAPFIDNHDTPRYTTSGTDVRKNKFQYALLQMLNGSTFTYYGDEVGMTGSNAGDLPDQNVRIPIMWGDEVGQCSSLGGATVESYPHGYVSTQMKVKTSIYNYYKKCLLIRNQNPEIARGKVTKIAMDRDNKLLFIKKTYNGSEIGIVFNFSPSDDLEVDYKSYGFNDVVGQLVVDNDTRYIGMLKSGTILLPSYSIAIVK